VEFPGAFTLFQSPIGNVRVEPPDLIVVDGPSVGQLRFTRDHVRTCSPMLVSYYRDNVDRSYAAPDPDGIVVLLEIEGVPRTLLGPFPHKEGVGLGNSINRARGTLLFAAPGFSLTVSSDDSKLVVDTVGPGGAGRIMVPIPTATLTGMAPRDNTNVDTAHSISTGISPSSQRFLELSFADGKPWLVGPFAPADAANITFAFRKWRTLHPVDDVPNTVDEATLRANPARFHGRRIEATGQWDYMFESSRFANAWLDLPNGKHAAFEHGSYIVRVVGTWIYPDAKAEHDYGHMGMSPGELRVESIHVLKTIGTAQTLPDGLTGLPKRSSFDGLIKRSLATGPGAFAIVAIDRMKLINDYNGFQAGDEVIRKVAETTRRVIRGSDFAVRWASDQIAILFSDMTMRGAHETLTNVLAAVRALEVKPGLRVTLSAGMAAMEPGCDVDKLSRLVEEALFAAKRAGRDRIVSA